MSLRRLTAVGLVALLAGCGSDAPATPAPGTPSAPWAAWAGTYAGHGFDFTIDAQGAGHLAYRTYLNCADASDVTSQPGVPCEDPYASHAGRVTFVLTIRGTQTVAQITASNDARVRGEVQVALIAPGEVRLSSGSTFSFTGCTDAVRPVPKECGGA